MYANTCWGLLGLTVTFGVAVLGLPQGSEWLAPWFTSAAVACAVGSLICFAWPLRQKANRVKLKELCQHPLKAVKLIEPTHVIFLGLLIAIGGVFWQWKRETDAPEKARTNRSQVLRDGQFEWQTDFFLPGTIYQDGAHYIRAIEFRGMYRGAEPAPLTEARVASTVTGEVMLLKVGASDSGFVSARRINPIQPNAPIEMQALLYDPSTTKPEDRQGLPAKDFLARWGGFSLSLDFADGRNASYKRTFTYEQVQKNLAQNAPSSPPTPRITVNPAAAPDEPRAVAPRTDSQKRYYTAKQKEELGDAMHRASQVISKDGMPAAREIYSLSNAADSGDLSDNALQSTIDRLMAAQDRVMKVETEIWKGIFANPADPIYDLQQILDSNHNQPHGSIRHIKERIGVFIRSLQSIKSIEGVEQRNRLRELVAEANAIQLRTAAEHLTNWMQQSLNKIGEKQREFAQQ